MALLRYLAPAALASALLAGCSQSLFDDLTGDGNDGDPDGSVARPDARPAAPDAGSMPVPDGGGPDGGNDDPDASVRLVCPEPCAGDAFDEFTDEQGGATGLWGYIDVHTEEPPGGQYVQMFPTTFSGSIIGWQGSGTPAPTIARCNTPVSESPCAELREVLALTTVAQRDALHRPGLRWMAPEYGDYLVTGSWRGATHVEGTTATLRFAINSEDGVVDMVGGTLETTPQTFEVSVDMQGGDVLVVSASADSDESVSIGMELLISGPF